MAAKTFNSAGVNNLWSNPANWGGAVPVDNDSVTIPAGQTCEFDVNISAFTNGIAGVVVNGTLYATRTAGTYNLKIKASTTISTSGTGTLDYGTTLNPIPVAAKHTISGGAGWYINGYNLSYNVTPVEPTNKYVRLVNNENVGSTRLEVDKNLTTDTWAVGDTIRICGVNSQLGDYESRTITAITSTYIDINTGLSVSKTSGCYVVLVTRSVTISQNGNFTPVLANFSGKTISGGSYVGTSNGYLFSSEGSVSSSVTISEGVFTGFNCAFFSSYYQVINGGQFVGITILIGGASPSLATNATINGGLFSTRYLSSNNIGIIINGGIFWGIPHLAYISNGLVINGGEFLYGYYGIHNCDIVHLNGGHMDGNLQDCITVCHVDIGPGFQMGYHTYGPRFVTGTMRNFVNPNSPEVYGNSTMLPNEILESINHQNVDGAYKSWTRNGICTDSIEQIPTGFTRSYRLDLQSDAFALYGWWRRNLSVPAGKTIQVKVYMRKNFTAEAQLPRVWFMLDGSDPFSVPTSIIHEQIMTNAVDTWETYTYNYTNTYSYDVMLQVRFLGHCNNLAYNQYLYTQLESKILEGAMPRSRLLGEI